LQELRFCGSPCEFLVEKLAFDGLILVLESFVWVIQIDLLDKLSEKILIEIGPKLV
jgi:hypothetical protein